MDKDCIRYVVENKGLNIRLILVFRRINFKINIEKCFYQKY
jgi:hypothetical protein